MFAFVALTALPAKVAFNRMDPSVIAARLKVLDRILADIAKAPSLWSHEALVRFCDGGQVPLENTYVDFRTSGASALASFFTPLSTVGSRGQSSRTRGSSRGSTIEYLTASLSSTSLTDEDASAAAASTATAAAATTTTATATNKAEEDGQVVYESHLGRIRIKSATLDYVFYAVFCDES